MFQGDNMDETVDLGVKDSIRSVIQSLPGSVTWDEVQYRLFVRQQIEAGLADSEAGRLIDTDEMRNRLSRKKEQAKDQ
jgi:predicted transcriptional regulator